MENSINLNFVQVIHFLAVMFIGLVAGLFYGYDCSVIKGLGQLSNDTYLQAFQSINNVIQNPYFFISFMGSLVTLPLTTWLIYKDGSSSAFYLMMAATVVYFIGVFAVTIFGNIPLNELLNNFSILNASKDEISEMRKAFEQRWNTFHSIRTFASIISFSLAVLSIIKSEI